MQTESLFSSSEQRDDHHDLLDSNWSIKAKPKMLEQKKPQGFTSKHQNKEATIVVWKTIKTKWHNKHQNKKA